MNFPWVCLFEVGQMQNTDWRLNSDCQENPALCSVWVLCLTSSCTFTVVHRGGWPWQAAIRLRGSRGDGRLVCGATLIDTCWVLTSAHCFKRSDTVVQQQTHLEFPQSRSCVCVRVCHSKVIFRKLIWCPDSWWGSSHENSCSEKPYRQWLFHYARGAGAVIAKQLCHILYLKNNNRKNMTLLSSWQTFGR